MRAYFILVLTSSLAFGSVYTDRVAEFKKAKVPKYSDFQKNGVYRGDCVDDRYKNTRYFKSLSVEFEVRVFKPNRVFVLEYLYKGKNHTDRQAHARNIKKRKAGKGKFLELKEEETFLKASQKYHYSNAAGYVDEKDFYIRSDKKGLIVYTEQFDDEDGSLEETELCRLKTYIPIKG